jgi:hypothetical protein
MIPAFSAHYGFPVVEMNKRGTAAKTQKVNN